jgi:hypothetical protein
MVPQENHPPDLSGKKHALRKKILATQIVKYPRSVHLESANGRPVASGQQQQQLLPRMSLMPDERELPTKKRRRASRFSSSCRPLQMKFTAEGQREWPPSGRRRRTAQVLAVEHSRGRYGSIGSDD